MIYYQCIQRKPFNKLAIEHYPEHLNELGKIDYEVTWSRVVFDSWTPHRVWIDGQEPVSIGLPDWRYIPTHEVETLIGKVETERQLDISPYDQEGI